MDTLGRVRKSELPEFTVNVLKSALVGGALVNTPPPTDASIFNFFVDKPPTPTGKFHITVKTISSRDPDEIMTLKEKVKSVKDDKNELQN